MVKRRQGVVCGEGLSMWLKSRQAAVHLLMQIGKAPYAAGSSSSSFARRSPVGQLLRLPCKPTVAEIIDDYATSAANKPRVKHIVGEVAAGIKVCWGLEFTARTLNKTPGRFKVSPTALTCHPYFLGLLSAGPSHRAAVRV